VILNEAGFELNNFGVKFSDNKFYLYLKFIQVKMMCLWVYRKKPFLYIILIGLKNDGFIRTTVLILNINYTAY